MLQTITLLLPFNHSYKGVFLISEPNNDSPLNTNAADLWKNQEAYKKVLLEHYHKVDQSVGR